jgi:hypothetical protein
MEKFYLPASSVQSHNVVYLYQSLWNGGGGGDVVHMKKAFRKKKY